MNRSTMYLTVAAMAIILTATLAYAAAMVEATDDSYHKEVVKSDKPVLLEFYATWCGACRKSEPTVRQIAAEMDGSLKVVRMNVDKCPRTTSRFKVRSIPAFFYMVDGVEKGSAVGAYPKDELLDKLGIPRDKE